MIRPIDLEDRAITSGELEDRKIALDEDCYDPFPPIPDPEQLHPDKTRRFKKDHESETSEDGPEKS